ncbi:MAG: hypothetical protein WCW17_00950 [Patescibacteria group bacterium]|jgi:hypothetical protein
MSREDFEVGPERDYSDEEMPPVDLIDNKANFESIMRNDPEFLKRKQRRYQKKQIADAKNGELFDTDEIDSAKEYNPDDMSLAEPLDDTENFQSLIKESQVEEPAPGTFSRITPEGKSKAYEDATAVINKLKQRDQGDNGQENEPPTEI